MARFGTPRNAQQLVYFGPKDAVAGTAPPAITGVEPATPEESATGVRINGTNFGTQQAPLGQVTYDGVPLTVTNWTDTQITVDWIGIVTNLPNGFFVDYDLVVQDADAEKSDPFPVQTVPRAGYQYELIGPRDSALGPDEGLFDDDTLGTGQTYVYGVESPVDGEWDFSNLSAHYIQGVPDGGTFTYRLWDVALGQWSNEATETFSVATASLEATPENIAQAHSLDDVTALRVVSGAPDSLAQAHSLGDVTALRFVSGAPDSLAQAQSLTEPTAVTGGITPVLAVPQLQVLTEPVANKRTAVQPQDLTQAQFISNVRGPSANRIEEAFIEQYNDSDGGYWPKHRARRRR